MVSCNWTPAPLPPPCSSYPSTLLWKQILYSEEAKREEGTNTARNTKKEGIGSLRTLNINICISNLTEQLEQLACLQHTCSNYVSNCAAAQNGKLHEEIENRMRKCQTRNWISLCGNRQPQTFTEQNTRKGGTWVKHRIINGNWFKRVGKWTGNNKTASRIKNISNRNTTQDVNVHCRNVKKKNRS